MQQIKQEDEDGVGHSLIQTIKDRIALYREAEQVAGSQGEGGKARRAARGLKTLLVRFPLARFLSFNRKRIAGIREKSCQRWCCVRSRDPAPNLYWKKVLCTQDGLLQHAATRCVTLKHISGKMQAAVRLRPVRQVQASSKHFLQSHLNQFPLQ